MSLTVRVATAPPITHEYNISKETGRPVERGSSAADDGAAVSTILGRSPVAIIAHARLGPMERIRSPHYIGIGRAHR